MRWGMLSLLQSCRYRVSAGSHVGVELGVHAGAAGYEQPASALTIVPVGFVMPQRPCTTKPLAEQRG